MGIKNFFKLVRKYAPNSIKTKKISDYEGQTLGIDANHLIYKSVMAIRKNGYDLKNDSVTVTHIHTMIMKLAGFKRYNIRPVFVFDGCPPQAKERTIEQRDLNWNVMKKKYYDANTEEQKKKYYFAKSDITEEEVKQVVQLLKLFGVTILRAKAETDPVLASLSVNGQIDAIVSDDADMLILGGTKLLKDFSIDKTKQFSEINGSKMKKKLGLKTDQLVDLAILLGSDYGSSIEGVGPERAYELIKKWKSLESIALHTKYSLPSGYISARKCLKTKVQIRMKPRLIDPLVMELIKFLHSLNYKQDKINQIINQF